MAAEHSQAPEPERVRLAIALIVAQEAREARSYVARIAATRRDGG